MPQKNSIKTFAPHEFYHIYNRGVAKQEIFRENEDKDRLLEIFERYLTPEKNQRNSRFVSYFEKLEINSFCLMDNHFHLLLWLEKDNSSIVQFMKSVFTSYSMYFNAKYDRVGPLFQSRYKASRIISDPYLLHISRYIHLNPGPYFQDYKYSSYSQFVEQKNLLWLNPDRILSLHPTGKYEEFVLNYYDYLVENKMTDHQLVDNCLV